MVRSTSWAKVVAVLALVVGLTVVGARPSAAAPSLSVTPATGLADWTYVHLTGSGFEPNALMEWFQCRGGAVDENDCDGYNADFIDADGAGNIDIVVPVDARIYLPDGTEVDCRTDPAGCELGVGYMLDADEWPEVALEFDPSLPLRPGVAATVEPSTGLEDGDVVAIHAEHVLPRFETWAFVCAAGDEMWGRRCHLDNEIRGVADLETETLDLELDVHPQFVTPFGDQIDCTTHQGGCGIVVAWGFSDQPDRHAVVPISFGQVAPSTSTTTTMPVTPTTRPATPRPPAATPVGGRPSYTG